MAVTGYAGDSLVCSLWHASGRLPAGQGTVKRNEREGRFSPSPGIVPYAHAESLSTCSRLESLTGRHNGPLLLYRVVSPVVSSNSTSMLMKDR